MTGATNPLGEFLRARRELVTPEQAGIPVVGVRRVAGLRREEVAMLSGISSEYYLRLEQGRYRNPSVQVLEAIARVLQLDEETTAYLLGLVVAQPHVARRRRPARETVPGSLRAFVDGLGTPAFIEGRYLDVLAANPLAAALSPRLVVGANRLRDVFLDAEERALFVDWEAATEGLVASFRQSVGTSIDDPRCVELVGQLSIASPRFQRLWGRHDIGGRRGALMRFDHPVVGEINLHREKLVPAEAQNLTVAIYHADAGSPDADKLALLAASVQAVVGS
ncbi:Helix-turn-helix domain-containing protein [Curtobacterium sp. 9128]|uniref:helix-turn-helix domain-containing protein n=1 Tax=Curtobacterium sp. 9128 TaxID=1793722 RepID=UPI0007D72E65|nr:helix-turn-helix transcriptional regulator [Curtobacterium sp. 9128]SBN64724.1 Helix-turn-helix domain-containing protein [Curtobacterium sp. 9128]